MQFPLSPQEREETTKLANSITGVPLYALRDPKVTDEELTLMVYAPFMMTAYKIVNARKTQNTKDAKKQLKAEHAAVTKDLAARIAERDAKIADLAAKLIGYQEMFDDSWSRSEIGHAFRLGKKIFGAISNPNKAERKAELKVENLVHIEDYESARTMASTALDEAEKEVEKSAERANHYRDLYKAAQENDS